MKKAQPNLQAFRASGFYRDPKGIFSARHFSRPRTRSLVSSFGAFTRSCFVPRYCSVVWTDAWPSSRMCLRVT